MARGREPARAGSITTTDRGNFRLDALQRGAPREASRTSSGGVDAPPNADRYDAFRESAAADRITRPAAAPDWLHIFNHVRDRVPDRNAVRAKLDAAGIGPRSTIPCRSTAGCFAPLGYRRGDFPAAEAAAEKRCAADLIGS